MQFLKRVNITQRNKIKLRSQAQENQNQIELDGKENALM